MGSVHLGLTMKFFALAFLVAAASAKDIRLNLLAPPTELEYGFCDGSPEPLTFDVISIPNPGSERCQYHPGGPDHPERGGCRGSPGGPQPCPGGHHPNQDPLP